MTALQLGKRVIDHDGPCHYRDRAALSNSAYILFEQSSERDEEHIERCCTIHLILYSNALISLSACSPINAIHVKQLFYAPFNRWVIGITQCRQRDYVYDEQQQSALSVYSYIYIKSFL